MLEEPDPGPLYRVGEAAGEQRGLERRAMRRVGGAHDPGRTDEGVRLLGSEPAQVVLAEAELALFLQLSPGSGRLRLAAHQVDGPALGELAVNALGGGACADHVDRVLHGPPHGDHGLASVPAGQCGVRGGEEGRAPPAVSSGRTEAGDLALEDDDPQARGHAG